MEYNNQVLKARGNGVVVDMLADRTDMSKDEVEVLMNTPIEQVIEQTERELADEIKESPSKGFDDIVDTINAKLDVAAKTAKRKKKGLR